MTAAQFNTYGRDNDLAYWKYTTRGDLVYATGATTLARRPILGTNAILKSNGTAPFWGNLTFAGMKKVIGAASFSTTVSFAGTYADITGAVVALTFPSTCSVLVIASVTGYNDETHAPAEEMKVRGTITGYTDGHPDYMYDNSAAVARNEALPYIWLQTGVAAGARNIKLQGVSTAHGTEYVTAGYMLVIGLGE